MGSARRWSDLKQTPAVDAALRRAAAGVVVIFQADDGAWCYNCEETGATHLYCSGDWLPDQNRDDLARVFQVGLLRAADKRKRGKFWTIYEMTLAAPRAALCALLDLLNIEPPEELN